MSNQNTYHNQTAKFLSTIAQSMPEVSADVMQGWIENPKSLQKTLAEALCPPETISLISCDQDSIKMLVEAGNYDYENPNITDSNFSVESWEGERVVELIHFDEVLSSGKAEKKLDKMGYRPATITELLAFGVKYPEEQRKFPIIALGSVISIDGSARVASLDGDGSKRGLDLDWRGSGWGEVCRFLAIRKTSES